MSVNKTLICALIAVALGMPLAAQDSMGHGRIGGPPAAGSRTVTNFPPGTRIARPTAPTGPRSAGSARSLSNAPPVPHTGGGGGGASIAETQWFWNVINPAQNAGRANRLPEAVDLMARAPQAARFTPPSAAAMAELARVYGGAITMATQGTSVSPALVLAVISVESGGQPQAQSPAGAQGLMQLIPATARRFHVTNPYDPRQNIRGGVAYLNWLLDHFGGDPILALAGYNAGEGAVRDNRGVPPFAETRAYVPKVVSAWRVARELCDTPPDHVFDPCALTGMR